MNRAFRVFRRNGFLLAAMVLLIAWFTSACQAQSPEKVEKHARKIEKHLAKYRTGTLVEVELRDDSEAQGTLGNLGDASFQITNADSNKVQTFAYADVARVKKTKEYIGAGSEPGHRVRLWVPIVIGAVAAGGAVAAYEATR